ncbi:Zn-dependent hydrolase [Acetobacter sp. DsW_063]|uniref:Zn-dependent hydrolase n=1 Tax=Acetobacter sp. DsW_063 TaxID=1514894 RepID=UPI000B6A9A5D|nr:Zn-dependent hydrolase [Acetobacter sp. DsW_063]OUJ14724.1 allantoate amidohydrolase [Acetobacter sp. DsW_063]
MMAHEAPWRTEPDFALAQSLFDTFQTIGFDGRGITRASYGEGEERAHNHVRSVAADLGLEVRTDWAMNLYVTLPGRDRSLPAVMTGSHLDSVPVGGNFDGAAGVAAGLSVLSGWVREGATPSRDVTLMAIRAEESAWFPVSYIGSKAAFGLLDAAALQARRTDTRRTLAEHIAEAGGDPEAFKQPGLDPKQIDCFVELHIEQGPTLIGKNAQVGIVTGICGSSRYRHAEVHGVWAHSGATPRAYRHDAVIGATRLVERLHREWLEIEADGGEMTLTFGVFQTDPTQADFSTIAGKVGLSIDVRSRFPELLSKMNARILDIAQQIAMDNDVEIKLGPHTGSTPAQMDDTILKDIMTLARNSEISAIAMPSGAGHDSAIFADLGVPTAMLFVRNQNGSHNPDEAMDFEDFKAGSRLLSQILANRSA